MSKKTLAHKATKRRQASLAAAASPEQGISIKLSRVQVAKVVREAEGDGLSALLFARLDASGLSESLAELLDDSRMSRSLILGWIVLVALMPPGTEHSLYGLAKELNMSKSTLHRYLNTLKAMGLMEQVEPGRRYRIVVGDADKAGQLPLEARGTPKRKKIQSDSRGNSLSANT